ncbi:MAG: helix-turn-helix domain-containing protein [Oscillospiraceae bacterium]|nr:helix-turn-helix domain-containing protein [Oscillospiraceae bacterium]
MDHRKSIQNRLDFIEENLKAQITAAELSERAGYSLFHYYRLFQPAVGMPVMQYILRRRLLHAIYEIHGGRKRIDVILEYGFETYAGFYKAFRREFGCTPSVYLKKRRARRPCKPNLYQEEHMTISHKKASEILAHWNLEKEPVSDIYYEGSGEKADSAFYAGSGFVLKFSADLDKVKKAAALSRLIENAGLQAASPVAAADGGEYVQDSGLFFYVTRRLSGTPLLSHGFFEGDYAAKARFAGEMIGQLHLVLCKVDTCVNDVNLYETVRDWAMPRAKDILPLPEPFRREYLETFGKLYGSLPRQIIHRDPHPGNIIVSQDKWGFIDFELSERNLRIYDPCYAALAVLSECFDVNRRDALDKWLEIYRNIIWGYDSVVKLTAEEKRALPYVVIANQLVCVAWFSGQDKYEDIFETNKRMTQWLISGFDELNI